MAINLKVKEVDPVALSVGLDAEVTLDAGETTVVGTGDYSDLQNKPSIEGIELNGNKSLSDLGAYNKAQTNALLADKANKSEIPSLDGYATELWVNSKGYVTQVWVENKHYLTEHQSLAEYYTKGQTNALLDNKADASDLPSKVSDLTNDAGYISAETDPTVPQWAKASTKPTYTASEVGALPDTTEIPSATSDLTNDSGFITGMSILAYGKSTWADFIEAYTAQKVVYCRASSNSNPATGSQTRLAFMAYVNNADSPSEVEFQYYRSVSSHSASQQGDQVYVYKLTNKNAWTVTVRESYTKIVAGTGINTSYANGTLTISLA